MDDKWDVIKRWLECYQYVNGGVGVVLEKMKLLEREEKKEGWSQCSFNCKLCGKRAHRKYVLWKEIAPNFLCDECRETLRKTKEITNVRIRHHTCNMCFHWDQIKNSAHGICCLLEDYPMDAFDYCSKFRGRNEE